jgi:hypothetical protein
LIENLFSRLREVERRVKHWQGGMMIEGCDGARLPVVAVRGERWIAVVWRHFRYEVRRSARGSKQRHHIPASRHRVYVTPIARQTWEASNADL